MGAGLLRQRCAPARPHDRSFGEAEAGRGRYGRIRSNGGRMNQGVGVVGLYVRDQEEVLQFYVGKLGFRVHTDARNGGYRWLTVQHPDQPSFQLGLFAPQAPMVDAATAQTLREIVAKGAMPPSCWSSTTATPPTRGCARTGWRSRRSRWHGSVVWTPASGTPPGTA